MSYGNYVETYKRVWYETSAGSLVYSVDVYYKYRQDSVNGITELTTQKIRFNQHFAGWGMPSETITVGLNAGSSSSASSSDTYSLSIPPNVSGNTYSEKEINKTIYLSVNSDGNTSAYIYWYAYATGNDAYKPAFNTWQSSSIDIPKMELVSKISITDTITVNGSDLISASWQPYKTEHRYRVVISFTGGAKKYLPDQKNYYKASEAEITAKLKTVSFSLGIAMVLSDNSAIGLKFSNNTSIYAGVWLETYDTSGNKLFTSPTALTTLVLSENVKPVIVRSSVTGIASIGTLGTRWITNKCYPVVTLSVSPPTGTVINSAKIRVQKYNGSSFVDEKTVNFNNLNNSAETTSLKLQPFTTSGKRQMIVNVTDGRGYTSSDLTVQFGQVESTQTFYSYHEPEVNTCTYLVDTANKKLLLNFAGSFSSINNLNSVKTLKFVITNKTTGVTTEHGLTISSWTLSEEDYVASYTLELPADGSSGQVGNVETDVFSYYLVFADQLYTTQTEEKSTGTTAISLLPGGKGAAFFKKATKEGLEINGNVYVDAASNGVTGIETIIDDGSPYGDAKPRTGIRLFDINDTSNNIVLAQAGPSVSNDTLDFYVWDEKNSTTLFCISKNSAFITPWKSIGSALNPVYFNASGKPVACADLTTKVIQQLALEGQYITLSAVSPNASIEGAVQITTKSGYTCMGSLGHYLSTTDDTSSSSYSKWLNCYRCQVYNNKLYYGITNIGDNTRTPKIYLYLLWVKV